jgi:hypothetical protein
MKANERIFTFPGFLSAAKNSEFRLYYNNVK